MRIPTTADNDDIIYNNIILYYTATYIIVGCIEIVPVKYRHRLRSIIPTYIVQS